MQPALEGVRLQKHRGQCVAIVSANCYVQQLFGTNLPSGFVGKHFSVEGILSGIFQSLLQVNNGGCGTVSQGGFGIFFFGGGVTTQQL